jgi:hypothetical protein
MQQTNVKKQLQNANVVLIVHKKVKTKTTEQKEGTRIACKTGHDSKVSKYKGKVKAFKCAKKKEKMPFIATPKMLILL